MVIGLGGVGLSAVMAAADAGASMVIALDTQPQKLELARQVGATHALEAVDADTTTRRSPRLTDGGADHVLECIGLTATVESAVELARPGGTITLVGMTGQADRAAVDVYRFVEDGKRLLGSNYGSRRAGAGHPAHRPGCRRRTAATGPAGDRAHRAAGHRRRARLRCVDATAHAGWSPSPRTTPRMGAQKPTRSHRAGDA